MKPKRIILIRHGESVGNVDVEVYRSTPDYAIKLTATGRLQAEHTGYDLKEIIGDESAYFYVSSYRRTKETFNGIRQALHPAQYNFREDPRLREQEWCGYLRDGFDEQAGEKRAAYSSFYYRFDSGESCADVYDRISNFLDTLHRDFEKADFANNAIIVSHGMAIRVFLMRWFHMSVEEFEFLRNPKNCGMIILELNNSTGKYELKTELVRYNQVLHPYHFPLT